MKITLESVLTIIMLIAFTLLIASFFSSAQGIQGSTGATGVNTSLTINAVSYEVTAGNMSKTIPLLLSGPSGQDYSVWYLLAAALFLLVSIVLFRRKISEFLGNLSGRDEALEDEEALDSLQ